LFFGIAYLLGKSSDASLLPLLAHRLSLIGNQDRESELLEKFRAELTAAVAQLPVAGKEPKLVVFIDELDRCRPNFAIELLERIKHLFDIPNIIFVLSIDKQQLEASTAAVYGAAINAAEYLRRFIDLEYGIPAANSKRYTENLIKRFDLDPVFAERKDQKSHTTKIILSSFLRCSPMRWDCRFEPESDVSPGCGSLWTRRRPITTLIPFWWRC
jgi:hypothetical protein